MNITQSIIIEDVEQNPGIKKLTCVSSKAVLAGGESAQYWKQNELANQIFRWSGVVLGAPAKLALCFSWIEFVDHFCFYRLILSLPLAPFSCPSLVKLRCTQDLFPFWIPHDPFPGSLPASLPSFNRAFEVLARHGGIGGEGVAHRMLFQRLNGILYRKRKLFLFSLWRSFSNPGWPQFLLTV